MIRTAISTIIAHRRTTSLAVATCTTTTAAYFSPPSIIPDFGGRSMFPWGWHRGSHAVFSSSDDDSVSHDLSDVPIATSSKTESPFLPLVNAINDMHAEITHYSSLVFPTIEALIRASRLAKTAAIMAADYQAYSFLRKNADSTIIFHLRKMGVFLNGEDFGEEKASKRHELEKIIDRLEQDLVKSQQNYVYSSSESDEKNTDDTDPTTISEKTLAKRDKKQIMMDIAEELAHAQEALSSLDNIDAAEHKASSRIHNVHQRNAYRLLNLCRENGGTYIKVGQHLANLDLLLPEEYISTLSSLFDDAPVSTIQDVMQVVKEELGALPEDMFSDFSSEPIASASLAQVHTAICKKTGKKLAIKVQHKGLRETSKGDLLAMSNVVMLADKLFEEFKFGWICEELTPQLPKELDFMNEGKNAETASAHLMQTGLDCVVPRVLWDFSSKRVLTMEFEEGFKATDVESIEKAGICRRDVAKLISSVFNSQIFLHGFVHCDPHEANVLLREHPQKKGKPQIVLVDHGLYKTLDENFQEAYARLWKAIVMADIPGIESACKSLGVQRMYPLLAAMLTSRPFDEVVERSQTGSFDCAGASQKGGDKAVIRGYAQRYIKEIIAMLDIVPRQMLLIFKMNDCLRHVDYALGSPANTLVIAGKYASRRVFESERNHPQKGGLLDCLRSWFSYFHVLFRINCYELWSHFNVSRINQ
mmetsp:Transcript_6892/g.14163  ORF Transcript_6892/g.14163 Transcript_6892/m.14163 type:complete len:703 (+) Transcript_6892:297-2405(+)